MADPINMDQMLEIFNKFSNQISESLKENKISNEAKLLELSSNMTQSNDALGASLNTRLDVISQRLTDVETRSSSRSGSESGSPAKVHPSLQYPPPLICNSYNGKSNRNCSSKCYNTNTYESRSEVNV